MKRIGERIKRKRELMGLHLGDLASQVGISASGLSQIERAKAFPSILTLKSIAGHLNTTVGELIGESDYKLDYYPVVKAGDEKVIEKSKQGAVLFDIDHHFLNKQMHPYIIELSGNSDFSEVLKNKSGQIFCMVLVGEVKFSLDYHDYQLGEGDSIYFSSKFSYNAENVGETVSRVLVMVSPPAF